jgi:ribosomal protein S18 acetylase RimI-like enzyme
MLRSLRLQALSDAPDAFLSTYEREEARTTADWQRWIEPNPTFVFEGLGDVPVGIVSAVRHEHEPTVVQLMSLWVHPSVRGTGVGDALVEAVIAWVVAERALTLRLWVAKENIRAIRAYERHGFRLTGNEVALRAREGAVEVEMHRP